MARPKESSEQKLLRRLLEHKSEPRALAQALDMSLEQLAQWLAQKRIQKLVHGLSSLTDFNAQVNLKAASLKRLANMLTEGADETTRRACADLLKAPPVCSAAAPCPEDDLVRPNQQQANDLLAHMTSMGQSVPP